MSRATFPLLVITSLALVGTVGCWTDGEMIDRAVWSDDDSGQAFVRLMFEEGPKVNPLSQTHPRRNFRHQIYVQNVDGSERHAVTEIREHRTGGNFFYMRRAGYLIIDVIDDSDVFRYDLIRLPSGSSTTIDTFAPTGEACESFEAIPSYSGQLIATIERTVDGGGGGACPTGRAIVTFLDASTLSSLSHYEWPVTDMVQAAWTTGDDFIVSAPNDGVWRVTSTHGPEPTDLPDCLYPRTSSGEVSADGIVIGGGVSVDDPITVFPPFPEGNPYGCTE